MTTQPTPGLPAGAAPALGGVMDRTWWKADPWDTRPVPIPGVVSWTRHYVVTQDDDCALRRRPRFSAGRLVVFPAWAEARAALVGHCAARIADGKEAQRLLESLASMADPTEGTR